MGCQEQVVNLQRQSVGKSKPDVIGIDQAERGKALQKGVVSLD